jgi:hypothetical protein
VTNSELQVRHYRLQRFVTMSGPARAIISTGSITVESGKAAVLSKETCVYPSLNFQDGLVTRGVSLNR